MMHSMRKFAGFILAILALLSCSRDRDQFNWKTQILTPIVTAKLSINDLAGDETQVKTNTDETISIVYSENIYSYSPDTLINLEVEPYIESFKIDQLQLSDINVTERYTMRDLFIELDYPLFLDGFTITINEPDSTLDVNFGPFEADFSEYVQSALLSNGTAEISLENQFPLDMRDVTVEIRNQSSGDLIESVYFDRIDSGEREVRSIDLAGKQIEGVLEMTVTNATIEVETYTIDLDDYVEANISIFDIEVEEATAVFPAQEIVRNSDQVELQGLNDAIIDEAIIDRGFVRVTAYSTVEEELYLTYEVPSATLNGVPFVIDVVVPPAPPGGQTSLDVTYDFDDYLFTFTDNKFDNTVVGRIDSSGIQRTITKQDSVYINLQIEELTPKCIRGYLGQQNIHVGPATAAINFLDKINASSLDFEMASLAIRIENLIGATAELDVQQLTATNTSDATAVSLSPTPPTLAIDRASDTITATSSILSLDETTYNTPSLINILPNEITYEIDMNTNPGGNAGGIDFAYKDKGFEAYLDLEIPLSLQASQLTLKDTSDFITGTARLPNEVENGELTFVFTNGFPFSGTAAIYFLDQFDDPIDSLVFNPIEEASLDATTRRVDEPSKTRIKRAFTPDELDRILGAEKMYLTATFTTEPTAEYIKIYEDYTLEVKIIGDFIYHANKPLD